MNKPKDYIPTEKEQMYDDLVEIADYIAYNNSDFICSTCLTVIDKMKEFIHDYYGLNKYIEFSDMIDATMEGDREDE